MIAATTVTPVSRVSCATLLCQLDEVKDLARKRYDAISLLAVIFSAKEAAR